MIAPEPGDRSPRLSEDQLERLIWRYLDDEATPRQRRALRRALRDDPRAEMLFDDCAALDREARVAMRRALGRPLAPVRPRAAWLRAARLSGLAAAACLVSLLWLPDLDRRSGEASSHARAFPSGGSWFAPPVAITDSFRDDVSAYERPRIGLADSQREWIVLPGKSPHEFIVIEVNRVRTKYVQVHEDY